MWFFTPRKIRRLKRELAVLLIKDRALRTVPGATTMDLPDKLVEIGHQIAVLRFEIKKLEGDDECDTYPS